MLFFSMSFIMWENGKKHLELSVNSKVQPENSSIGSLHPLSHYLSSFAALFQLNHILFPSGLLLFSASLAANELRYRTACLLSLFFPNIYWGAGCFFFFLFPLGRGLVVWGELEISRQMRSTLMLTDLIVLMEEFLVKMKIILILLNHKIYLLLSSMNVFYSEL